VGTLPAPPANDVGCRPYDAELAQQKGAMSGHNVMSLVGSLLPPRGAAQAAIDAASRMRITLRSGVMADVHSFRLVEAACMASVSRVCQAAEQGFHL